VKRLAVGLIALMLAAGAPWFAQTALADMTLGALFGDNMVLQRGRSIPFWGWDEPGITVTVSCGDAVSEARAGGDGKWMTEFPAMDAGGPHEFTIKGSSEVKLTNVLVGEVWLCSGQPNIAVHRPGRSTRERDNGEVFRLQSDYAFRMRRFRIDSSPRNSLSRQDVA